MIKRCCETSGSLGHTTFKGRPNPIDKYIDRAKEMQRIKEIQNEIATLERIQNKPENERTLEEKIFLANYYGKLIVANVLETPTKIYTA